MEALEGFFARQQAMLDKGYAELAGKLEAQAQLIHDLVVEKQKWQQDKTTLLTDMANLRLTVKRLETLCYPFDGVRVGQQPEVTRGATVKETHNHAILVRSDDIDPLVPVVTQLTEKVKQVSAGLQALTNHVNEVSESLSKTSASVFVNWGSSACPNSSELVYTGAVGGAHYNEAGAAANYLCLPLSDVKLASTSHNSVSHIYGGEYQTNDEHNNKDPVCAVCRSSRDTNVMIPATTVCPAGWTSEYNGWLMTGGTGHAAASEFICVNSRMEERQGSDANLDGKLMYYVYTVCGSLPCPPYTDSNTVTCVVCSK
ncbi:uncharacterized protein LOC112564363 isoform X3 [Pomacea canaliculata]|nr:uncharacterized protein LOC112564363 isoform X3 [Pomacea canaliculata]